ncbi:MAG: hypothetical protein ABEJ23_01990 [Haloarculaceae archaeon]
MDTTQSPTRRDWAVRVVPPAAGLLTAVVVYVVVGSVLFARLLEEAVLANAIALPGGLALGAGVGVTARRVLLGERLASPLAIAVATGGAAYVAVGGPLGVYASVSASPFRDLALTVGVALAVAVGVAGPVYRHLYARTGGVRPGAARSLAAVVAGVTAGVVGALGVLLALTAALDPYVWPAVFVSGPLAIVGGLVVGILLYRWVARGRRDGSGSAARRRA